VSGRLRALALAALLAFGCRGGGEAPLDPDFIYPELDTGNLLTVASGVVVLGRSGEFDLRHSSIQAIDGEVRSPWVAIPGNDRETLVLELPATTVFEVLGSEASAKSPNPAREIAFESSRDGVSWTPLAVVARESPGVAAVELEPREVDYLRVSTVAGFAPGTAVSVPKLVGRGRETSAPLSGSIDGRWRLNHLDATFSSEGSRFRGTIPLDPPMTIEGGSDGRMFRFVWMRGKGHGVGVATVSRDGQRLNMLTWHQWIAPMFFASAYFGERTGDGSVEPSLDTASGWLAKNGAIPLYGLVFGPEGELDAPRSAAGLELAAELMKQAAGGKLRFAGHEFRQESQEANRAVAQKQLDSLRRELERRGVPLRNVTFFASGDRGRAPETPLALVTESRIDLEVR
jgi:hypothetical protein